MGDVAMVVPVLRELLINNKNYKVSFLTNFQFFPLFRTFNQIDLKNDFFALPAAFVIDYPYYQRLNSNVSQNRLKPRCVDLATYRGHIWANSSCT